MAADHHLLFGLLALQTGLIDQAALFAAFHAWTQDKGRTLADQFVALGYLGRSGEARDRHTRAVALAEALASASPKVPSYRGRQADSLRRLGWLKLDTGETPGADADARRAVTLFEGLPSRDGREWFALACARATLAAAAGRGRARTSTLLAPGLADQAMTDLRQAAAAGWRNPAAYRYEPALGLLRDREDFKLLMMDLAMPAEPFATAR
jgi:eukaryotic-like serine/threonine-protein kinase